VWGEGLCLSSNGAKLRILYYKEFIFSASQIIEKHREFNIPTYIAFIDFKKAFDSVERDKLWTIMSSKGIPTHLITAIQKTYGKHYKS
jgi:hypothetical protein